MTIIRNTLIGLLSCIVLFGGTSYGADAPDSRPGGGEYWNKQAYSFHHADRMMMLGTARAGKRIVAVGERGVVMLSDDYGRTYRQASGVPTRAMLNSVIFVNDKEGWAVGHRGIVLKTEDRGDTWKVQRSDLNSDRPLFSVYFKDAKNGIAVGLFSLVLVTSDGGDNWVLLQLPTPPGAKRADINLFRVFADRAGTLYIAGEQGLVYRSKDWGKTWSIQQTGYSGTFWCGIAIDDETIIVAGLRGSLYRSADAGQSWLRIDTHTQSSITDVMDMPNGDIEAISSDGDLLVSEDHGNTFKSRKLDGVAALTALSVNASGEPILFSVSGVEAHK